MLLSNMGEEEDEREPCFPTLEFPYLPLPADTMLSPEDRSGTATPPLQTVASVPFKWEEQPGKPRQCTDIVVRPEPAKCLELPPCRMLFVAPTCQIAKMPSPTTVLDGPYIVGRSKFSSFRLFREAQAGSFDSSGGGGAARPQSSVDILLGKKKATRFSARSLRVKSGRNAVDGGSFGFSPSTPAFPITGYDSVENMRRRGSSSNFSHAASTHLWVTVCESLKKAMPWKSTRKSKKEGACLKECDV